jgi:hypothetical protein
MTKIFKLRINVGLFLALILMFIYGVSIVGAFFFTLGMCLISLAVDWWLQ